MTFKIHKLNMRNYRTAAILPAPLLFHRQSNADVSGRRRQGLFVFFCLIHERFIGRVGSKRRLTIVMSAQGSEAVSQDRGPGGSPHQNPRLAQNREAATDSASDINRCPTG